MQHFDLYVFSTYLIVTTIGMVLSVVLFFTKGIATSSPRNRLYVRGKNLVAASALTEAITDSAIIIYIMYGDDNTNLDRFFVPVMFYIQLCLMVIAMLNFLHSQKLSLRFGMAFVIPVALVAATHIGIFVCNNGFAAILDTPYTAFLHTQVSQAIATVLYALIIAEAILATYIIIQKTIRFHNNIDNYVSGAQGVKSHWIIYTVAAFVMFFVVSAADFLVSDSFFDTVVMWGKTIIFTIATICVVNTQGIFLDVGEAFNPTLERMIYHTDLADSKAPGSNACAPISQHDGNGAEAMHATDETDPIFHIIDEWTNRADHPYLAESITINQVAEQMGINKRLLSQYLNNVMHLNFNTWINQLKVEEVKRIIATKPQLNFTCIAAHAGFSDAPAMSKIFKKVCGMSPSDYRNSFGGGKTPLDFWGRITTH